MGILDNLFGGNQTKGKRGFKQVLTDTGDFTTTDHQTLGSTSEYHTIAYYQVPAQTKVRVGYGNPDQEEDMGRIYAYIRTGEATPDEIPGKLRIIAEDYNGFRKRVVFEHDENMLHGSLTDKHSQVPVPEDSAFIAEDSYIKVQIKPDSTHNTSGAGNDNVGWADTTESILKVPITVYA